METKNLEYNGNCAFALSTGKTGVEGEAIYLTKNNKTYDFSNPVAKLLFRVLPGRAEKANALWNQNN